jgi:hypothetical protein
MSDVAIGDIQERERIDEVILKLKNLKDTCSKYRCELIQHKADKTQLKNTQIPNDTYIINYKLGDEFFSDLCRAKKMCDVFDLYYDILRNDSLLSIDNGYGVINPRNWNYKKTDTKESKRKRRSS